MEISNLVPSNSASMEGIFLGNISPIKTRRNNAKVKYFEGQLSDGAKMVRFVSFEPKLRSQYRERIRSFAFFVMEKFQQPSYFYIPFKHLQCQPFSFCGAITTLLVSLYQSCLFCYLTLWCSLLLLSLSSLSDWLAVWYSFLRSLCSSAHLFL